MNRSMRLCQGARVGRCASRDGRGGAARVGVGVGVGRRCASLVGVEDGRGEPRQIEDEGWGQATLRVAGRARRAAPN